jgi:hypothetical protein
VWPVDVHAIRADAVCVFECLSLYIADGAPCCQHTGTPARRSMPPARATWLRHRHAR